MHDIFSKTLHCQRTTVTAISQRINKLDCIRSNASVKGNLFIYLVLKI